MCTPTSCNNLNKQTHKKLHQLITIDYDSKSAYFFNQTFVPSSCSDDGKKKLAEMSLLDAFRSQHCRKTVILMSFLSALIASETLLFVSSTHDEEMCCRKSGNSD